MIRTRVMMLLQSQAEGGRRVKFILVFYLSETPLAPKGSMEFFYSPCRIEKFSLTGSQNKEHAGYAILFDALSG